MALGQQQNAFLSLLKSSQRKGVGRQSNFNTDQVQILENFFTVNRDNIDHDDLDTYSKEWNIEKKKVQRWIQDRERAEKEKKNQKRPRGNPKLIKNISQNTILQPATEQDDVMDSEEADPTTSNVETRAINERLLPDSPETLKSSQSKKVGRQPIFNTDQVQILEDFFTINRDNIDHDDLDTYSKEWNIEKKKVQRWIQDRERAEKAKNNQKRPRGNPKLIKNVSQNAIVQPVTEQNGTMSFEAADGTAPNAENLEVHLSSADVEYDAPIETVTIDINNSPTPNIPDMDVLGDGLTTYKVPAMAFEVEIETETISMESSEDDSELDETDDELNEDEIVDVESLDSHESTLYDTSGAESMLLDATTAPNIQKLKVKRQQLTDDLDFIFRLNEIYSWIINGHLKILLGDGLTYNEIIVWFRERKIRENDHSLLFPLTKRRSTQSSLIEMFEESDEINEQKAEELAKITNLSADSIYRWFLTRKYEIEEKHFLEQRRKERKANWEQWAKDLPEYEASLLEEHISQLLPPLDLEKDILTGHYGSYYLTKQKVDEFVEVERNEESENRLNFFKSKNVSNEVVKKLHEFLLEHSGCKKEFIEATQSIRLSVQWIYQFWLLNNEYYKKSVEELPEINDQEQ